MGSPIWCRGERCPAANSVDSVATVRLGWALVAAVAAHALVLTLPLPDPSPDHESLANGRMPLRVTLAALVREPGGSNPAQQADADNPARQQPASTAADTADAELARPPGDALTQQPRHGPDGQPQLDSSPVNAAQAVGVATLSSEKERPRASIFVSHSAMIPHRAAGRRHHGKAPESSPHDEPATRVATHPADKPHATSLVESPPKARTKYSRPTRTAPSLSRRQRIARVAPQSITPANDPIIQATIMHTGNRVSANPGANDSTITPMTVTAGGPDHPAPRYPSIARRRGLHGRVVILVELSPDGTINHAIIDHSSGHRILDHAALKAVKHWRFSDGLRRKLTIPITFLLDDAKS